MGGIQLIPNRYLFVLHYRYQDQRRRWRCTDYKRKCPAKVVTMDNLVVRRMGAHNHPFQDQKILRKVSAGKVYTALRQVESLTKPAADYEPV